MAIERLPTEKGAGVSASPPCRLTFGLRARHRGCARLHVGGIARSAPARVADQSGLAGSQRALSVGRSPGRARSRRISFPPRCPLLHLCPRASASRFGHPELPIPKDRRVSMARPVHFASRSKPPEAATSRTFGHPVWLVPKHLPALTTRSTFARRLGLRVWSPGLSMLRGSISCPGGPPFPCRSIGETFWTPDPFRFHPTRSRERDGPFPGVVSPHRSASFPKAPARIDPLQTSDFALISRRVFVRLQG